jgi:cytochrome P450
MLVASHDTTVNMIANGIFLLLSHPYELDKLISNPHLAPSATEEILRFESPTQRASYRVTKDFIKIKSMEVEPNTQVMVFLGAANRDPSVFTNPNEFNITREDNDHLAFGHGIHNCLGKMLARLEGNLFFSAIAPFLSELKLNETKPNWRKNTLFRIQKNLVVKRSRL